MRSSFEDASQGPRMVCSVGRSVDARAGCAVPVRSSSSHSEQARRHGDSPQVCSAVQIFLEMITSRFFERKVVMTRTDFCLRYEVFFHRHRRIFVLDMKTLSQDNSRSFENVVSL